MKIDTERQKHLFQGKWVLPVLVGILVNLLIFSTALAEASGATKLLFLGNKNIAPVIYLDHATPKGVAVDLVQALAPHLPQPIEIGAVDWLEAQALVARGEADALIQINPTEERKKIYDFSEPLLESQFSIFTSASKVGISGIASLRGLRVGVEAGGLPQLLLQMAPEVVSRVIPNFVEGFKLLNEGAIDAVVVDYRVGTYILAENRLRNIKVSGEPIGFSYSSIAVKKGNTKLLGAINNALQIIKTDGSYQKIIDNWKPTEVVFETQQQVTHRVYYLTILLLLVLILIAVIWTLTLRRELAKRKAAEGRLQAQYSTLSGIINSANALIFSVDRQYRYTSFNLGHAATMKALYGVQIEQGHSLLDYMTVVQDRETARRNLDRALAGEQVVEESFSGEELRSRQYFQVSHSPINREQEIIGVAVLAQDMSERKQAELRLHASELEFRAVVENTPDVIVRYDREGRRIFVNPEFERVNHLSARDVLGKKPVELSTELAPRAAVFTEQLMAAMASGSITKIDLSWTKEGKPICWYVRVVPEFDASGKVVSALTIWTDITERKQAEVVRTQLAAIVQSSHDAIIGKDLEGVITSWNPGAQKVYGYALEEVVGKPVSMLAPEDRRDEITNLLERIRRGQAVINFETERLRKDGKRIDIALDLSPIRDASGRIFGVSTIARDISEKKLAERALHRVNRALKALSDCNQALIHATDEVQLLNEICRVIVNAGGYRLAWVGIPESDAAKTVRAAAHYGYDEGFLAAANVSWADTERGAGPSGTALRTGAVQANRNFLTDPALAPWREAALERGYHSSMALPLKSSAGTLGVLTIYASEADTFNEAEVSLLLELAEDLAFGIETLRTRAERDRIAHQHQHHEEILRHSLEDSIKAIADTVEMRDPYTAGHQRRVGQLAAAIGKELGLSEETNRGIELAASIHDLGKISVPAEILSKPSKLTPIELMLIKNHAQAGFDILKDIQFPWPIASMVLQHHERQDGSGYPQGLRGEQILLESRILAVADVVEAMASHRPYRAALGIESALQEIERGRGTVYDAAVVDACLRLFVEKRFVLSS